MLSLKETKLAELGASYPPLGHVTAILLVPVKTYNIRRLVRLYLFTAE